MIILSVFITMSTAVSLLRLLDKERGPIEEICQASFSRPEALKTTYLAELLNLSKDQITLIDTFNRKWGEQALLKAPNIKEAKIKKMGNALEITYDVRRPYALLYDYENIAVDEEGFLFPIYPFLSPKRLVEIVMGLSPFDETIYPKDSFYEMPLSGSEFALAKEIIAMIAPQADKHQFFLKRVDVSKSTHPSLGQREIVLILETTDHTHHFLRLPVKGYEKQIANYLELYSQGSLGGIDRTIDLRIASLAYISD